MINFSDSLGKALGFTLRMYGKTLSQLFEEEGLEVSVDQFVMMNIIYQHSLKYDLTQIDLSNIVGKDKSAILRHMDYLESIKLLKRKDDAEDRRRKIISLTAKGEQLLNKARAI